MKRTIAGIILAVTAALAILMTTKSPKEFKPDVVAANDLVESVLKSWPDVHAGDEKGGRHFSRVTVVKPDGSVLYSRGRVIKSDREAMRIGGATFDLSSGGRHLGRLRIYDGWLEKEEAARQTVLRVAGGTAVVVAGLCIIAVIGYRRRVLRPFKQLSFFAREIAGGNLDVPLRMDRSNLFGPFTDSTLCATS